MVDIQAGGLVNESTLPLLVCVPTPAAELPSNRSDDKRRHFVRDQVEACKRMRGIDILMTHEAARPFVIVDEPNPGKKPVRRDAGKPAITLELSPEDKVVSRLFWLMTDKPTIFACNVKEGDLATADTNPYVMKVRQYVETHLSCEAVVISAQIESDLVDLAPDEADAFLKELGVQESGIGALIRSTYHLLGLQTYFTAGEKEVRAWTIHQGDTAPKAAGVIHSDFERGFIKAETVAYDDLLKCGSVAAAREKGLYRMEGKEYVVDDGDVLLFKFNV